MRKVFTECMLDLTNKHDTFFLTGDLGFMALEEVQEAYGDRFVNVGVAEQNMIGVAAGLSKLGNTVFAYSIAPFCYARPFEQVRNDLSFSKLPVCLVGNGGGYGYGYMGPTHHALEDCSIMSSINLKVFIPAFDQDVKAILSQPIITTSYLRLGYDDSPNGFIPPDYQPWRKIFSGSLGVMVVLGPLVGNAIRALKDMPEFERPSLWVVCEFDATIAPSELWTEVSAKPLMVYEEHVRSGGLGSLIALECVNHGVTPSQFIHHYAQGYPSKRYGSQKYHRGESQLDEESMQIAIQGLVNA